MIDFSEFKELKVQVIVSVFSCSQSDISLAIVVETRDAGNIELYKNSNGTRYISMYVSLKENYDESVEICLSKISKIKNLKSLAFPEKLVKYPAFGMGVILKKFIKDNPTIKVYVLRENMKILGVKDKNVVENKVSTSSYMSSEIY